MFARRPSIDHTHRDAPISEGERLLEAATDYLRRGWSLIPLLGKQPALASWKEFQTRAPTRGEVAFWFQEREPRPTGVGIVTGKLSGIVVVDCDTPEETTYWLGRFPTSPLMVKTGRGGAHIYYAYPHDSDVNNRVKIHRRAIDVRGEGGYVAAPPSQHPSGKEYAWTEPGACLQEPLPLFDAAWLLDSDGSRSTSHSDFSATQVRNVVAYIRRIHATAGEGGHNATFRAACKLRDAGLSEEEAMSLLRDWNTTNAHPPWSERDLAHKMLSAFKALTR